MSINDSHELSAQVFGGGGRKDTPNEVGSESRGSSWMMLPTISRKGTAKRSWTMAIHFLNLAWTRGVDVVEILSKGW